MQNTSICGHNNSITAEDYLNIYMTSALYTQKLKMSKTSSRYNKIAPPCWDSWLHYKMFLQSEQPTLLRKGGVT